ncbi:MAG: isochorismatase family protein [candidate division Zixibacteria bacterium]|nr:isochorismatase family protein [candidate division Zixibacteria bacterium]
MGAQEHYVTPLDLKDKTKEWKEEIASYNLHHMELDSKRSCLLVIDMQNYFLDPASPSFIPAGLAVLPNVARLIKSFRERKLPVIYTAHVHKSKELDGGILGWWWEGMIIENTKDAEIHLDLAPLPEEKVVYKHRYSAFYNTDLETVLRCLDVKDLLITGVMTNLCCESTARDAYFRDHRVFFVMDAAATLTEELHLATLRNLAYGFAYVTDTQDIVQDLLKEK